MRRHPWRQCFLPRLGGVELRELDAKPEAEDRESVGELGSVLRPGVEELD